MTTATHLSIRWSVSRGRDTYGYNIVTLTDTSTGDTFRATGGGYDMVGTVFGAWLEKNYQAALRQLAPARFAGLTVTDGKARLEGATGLQSMLWVAEALSLSVTEMRDRNAHTIGFTVPAD